MIDKKVQEHCARKIDDFESRTRLIWPILRIFSEDLPDLVQKQKSIQDFSLCLCSGLEEPISATEIPSKAWEHAHKWILTNLILRLASFKRVSSVRLYRPIDTFEWLNRFYEFIQQHVPTDDYDSEAGAIIPDRNGEFRPVGQLSVDRVPDAFKNSVLEIVKLDFGSQLLHPKITTVRLRQTIDIIHILSVITQRFCSFREQLEQARQGYANGVDRIQAEELKVSLAILHILPAEGTPRRVPHEALLSVVRSVFTEMHRTEESTLSEGKDIWHDALEIVLPELVRRVEKLGRLDQIPGVWDRYHFIRTLHSILDSLKPELASKCAIYPNQLGQLKSCHQLAVTDQVPEDLITGLRELSALAPNNQWDPRPEDLRAELVDERLGIQFQWRIISLVEVCQRVDHWISKLFKDDSYHTNPTFKKWAIYVNRTWFHDDSAEGRRLFPDFARSRGMIVCDVIFDKETRDLVSEFASFSRDEIHSLINEIRGVRSLRQELDRLQAKLLELQRAVKSVPKSNAN
jgi:hypothetical protein